MQIAKKIFHAIEFELFIFAILFLDLIRLVPIKEYGFGVRGFVATPYLVSYQDFGIIPRGFIGSIIRLFRSHISIHFLSSLFITQTIVLLILVTFTLGKVIRKSKDNKIGMILLSLLYLASPASISYLFTSIDFGRLDVFLILISILCVFLTSNKYLKWLIPLLCVIATAIHEAFLLTYFVLVLVVLIYQLYEENSSKSSIIVTGLTCSLTCITFIYLQFFTSIKGIFQNPHDMANYLMNFTELSPNESVLEMEYFSTISYHFNYLVYPRLKLYFQYLIETLILLSPLLYIISKTWFTIFKNTADKKMRVILTMMMLSPLSTIPLFLVGVDWGRWVAGILIVQFSYFFFLDYKQRTPKFPGILDFSNATSTDLIITTFTIVYLPTLGKFFGTGGHLLPEGIKFPNILYIIKYVISTITRFANRIIF